MTDRYVSSGYDSVAEGRRACQVEADKTPVEPYEVEMSDVLGKEARVVLAVDDGTRLIFWLVPHGERGWKIDGYEERPGDDSIGAAEVMAEFERETGERLERIPELTGFNYMVLGFPDLLDSGGRPSDPERFHELLGRFGAFHIAVAFSAQDAKRTIKGAGPDRQGIHWTRGKTGARLWTAEKRYGNVVLSWTGGEAKRTDGDFDRLDGIVRSAVASAG